MLIQCQDCDWFGIPEMLLSTSHLCGDTELELCPRCWGNTIYDVALDQLRLVDETDAASDVHFKYRVHFTEHAIMKLVNTTRNWHERDYARQIESVLLDLANQWKSWPCFPFDTTFCIRSVTFDQHPIKLKAMRVDSYVFIKTLDE